MASTSTSSLSGRVAGLQKTQRKARPTRSKCQKVTSRGRAEPPAPQRAQPVKDGSAANEISVGSRETGATTPSLKMSSSVGRTGVDVVAQAAMTLLVGIEKVSLLDLPAPFVLTGRIRVEACRNRALSFRIKVASRDRLMRSIVATTLREATDVTATQEAEEAMMLLV